MDCLQFISVVDQLSGSGEHSINIILTSFNATPNVAITTTVTGNSSLSCIDLARNIELALLTELASEDALFGGDPVFSGSDLPATWYVTRSDHVVSIWSQAQFSISITLNPVANTVLHTYDLANGYTPLLVTLDELDEFAVLYDITLETPDGTALTKYQKMLLIRMASDKLVRTLRNNIVISSYLHEEIGTITNSIRLKKRPIVSWDAPRIRTPGWLTLLGVIRTVSSYNVLTQSGFVNFTQASGLINVNPPFDYNNQIRMSYRAGYFSIPSIIKEKVLQLLNTILEDGGESGGIKSLSGGTGKVEYFGKSATSSITILEELREFIL